MDKSLRFNSPELRRVKWRGGNDIHRFFGSKWRNGHGPPMENNNVIKLSGSPQAWNIDGSCSDKQMRMAIKYHGLNLGDGD